MDAILRAFHRERTPAVVDQVRWAEKDLPLQIVCYRDTTVPPIAYISSVRCVLLRDSDVMVQRDRTTTHILPGGRREGDESVEAALRREVREETGWAITAPRLLGFMHFHDPNPAPPGHPYPHPDFLQMVYTARATILVPGARLDDGYELSSVFVPIANAIRLPLSTRERFFLAAARDEA
jgi:ADP-ribose pyrophosphatase YjhB (NUDIX family)